MIKNYLITGCCGFLGFSFSKDILKSKKIKVYGIDNLNNYYSKKLKIDRLRYLQNHKNFIFIKQDLKKKNELKKKLKSLKFEFVYHFAAQPGVRYSVINPTLYYETNVIGFNNLVNNLNFKYIKRFIYASSSSVYGNQNKFPTKESAKLRGKNPYAMTKIINEYQAQAYEQIYKTPFIGLRFFTVYGEWGRPDMFILKLLESQKKKKFFYLNNNGNHKRDFTYIKDVNKILEKIRFAKLPKNNKVFNVCAGKSINLKLLLKEIKLYYPNIKIKNTKRDNADVLNTFGSNKKIISILKLKKFISYKVGIKNTVEWYKKSKSF